MARNQAVLRHLQSHPQLSTIVLTMRYEGYPGLTEGDIARGLAATIATLPDRRFVIVGPWPKPKFDVPNGLVRLQLSDRWHVKPFLPRAHHIADRAGVWRAIGSLTDNPRVRAIDPAPSVCFGARCPYILDGQLLYFDDNHPSFVATDRVAARLAATFPR